MPALVVPLGPNPAALCEALWRLCADGEEIDGVWIVLESREAGEWYRVEAPGPLAELRARFPERLGDAPVHLCGPVADTPDAGTPDARAFAEEVFAAVVAAQAAAARVVLTLSGGRWRGSSALTSTVFQLLARPGDRLVDVRVDRREAEGGSGFFFPEQAAQRLWSRRGPFRADQVDVQLVPVVVPLLRPFLGPHPPASFAAALADTGVALEEAAPPEVRLDLYAGSLEVGGAAISLSPFYFPYVGWLLVDRAQGGAGIPTGDHAAFIAFLTRWERAAPGGALARRPRGGIAQKLLDLAPEARGELRDQVSRARGAWHEALAKAGVPRADLLTVSFREQTIDHELQPVKQTRHRIALPPDRIVLVGRITDL